MVDKSVPVISVAMIKDDIKEYPQYRLPIGYKFCMYQPGLEKHWANLETSVGEFPSVPEALEYFNMEFMVHSSELEKRCIFVRNSKNEIVGTSSAWFGDHFGSVLPRIHWVSVDPRHQGKGIAKALIAKTLDVFQALGMTDKVYLTTRTWSWKAINMYLQFGFLPYMGSEPINWHRTKVNFENENELAWNIIFAKLKLTI